MARTPDDLLLIDTPYSPNPGSFSRPKCLIKERYQIGPWHECREVWHGIMPMASFFFYAHPAHKTRSIHKFLNRVESSLGVPESKVGPTQRKTISWVEPSPWWYKGAMKRSLYTILLRVGDEYKASEDNFSEALYSHPYTEHTRYAVERFLSGCTRYTGRKTGWYKQFCISRPSQEMIDTLLVK